MFPLFWGVVHVCDAGAFWASRKCPECTGAARPAGNVTGPPSTARSRSSPPWSLGTRRTALSRAPMDACVLFCRSPFLVTPSQIPTLQTPVHRPRAISASSPHQASGAPGSPFSSQQEKSTEYGDHGAHLLPFFQGTQSCTMCCLLTKIIASGILLLYTYSQ